VEPWVPTSVVVNVLNVKLQKLDITVNGRLLDFNQQPSEFVVIGGSLDSITAFADAFFNYGLENRMIEISCFKRGEASFSMFATLVGVEQINRWCAYFELNQSLSNMFTPDAWKAALTQRTNEYFETVNAPYNKWLDLQAASEAAGYIFPPYHVWQRIKDWPHVS